MQENEEVDNLVIFYAKLLSSLTSLSFNCLHLTWESTDPHKGYLEILKNCMNKLEKLIYFYI